MATSCGGALTVVTLEVAERKLNGSEPPNGHKRKNGTTSRLKLYKCRGALDLGWADLSGLWIGLFHMNTTGSHI
jgi:hypothetical protein